MADFELKVISNPDSLEAILEYDPTTTIIFGGETEVYKSVGFYYSFPLDENQDNVVTEYTDKIKTIGEKSCYEMHRAMYHEEVLRANREEVGSANTALLTLLHALDMQDYEKVSDILKYDMETITKAADKLQNVYSILDKDSSWEIKALNAKQQYKDLVLKYNEVTEEVNELRKKSGTTEELVLVKEELRELNEKYAKVTNELAEANANLKTMHSNAEFEELREKLDLAEEQLKEARKKKEAETSYFANSEDKDKDELIAILKTQLSKVQQSSGINLEEALPIITSTLHLNANTLITLKEIKRAPYINTLVEWLRIKATSQQAQKTGSRMLIVIYDHLTDLNQQKYTKLRYAINAAPDPSTPIVVTSNLTQAFLRNVLSIASYNYIVIIDRLGSFKLVTERTDSKNYFLIDSASDIDDFKLDPEKCIAYYDSKDTCAADVLPDPALATLGKRDRLFKIRQNEKLVKLFK